MAVAFGILPELCCWQPPKATSEKDLVTVKSTAVVMPGPRRGVAPRETTTVARKFGAAAGTGSESMGTYSRGLKNKPAGPSAVRSGPGTVNVRVLALKGVQPGVQGVFVVIRIGCTEHTTPSLAPAQTEVSFPHGTEFKFRAGERHVELQLWLCEGSRTLDQVCTDFRTQNTASGSFIRRRLPWPSGGTVDFEFLFQADENEARKRTVAIEQARSVSSYAATATETELAASMSAAAFITATEVYSDGDEGSDGESPGGAHAKIRRQIDASLKSNLPDPALLLSCVLGDEEYLDASLAAGGQTPTVDEAGYHAVYFAAMSGSARVLEKMVKADPQGPYNSRWFDSIVQPDGVTVLMKVMQHGLPEVYKFLVDQMGCKLQLRGDAAGSAGPEQPAPAESLQLWLRFLPEINSEEAIAPFRAAVFNRTEYLNDVLRTANGSAAAVFDDARLRRSRVRAWLREKLDPGDGTQAEVPDEEKATAVPTAIMMPGRSDERSRGLWRCTKCNTVNATHADELGFQACDTCQLRHALPAPMQASSAAARPGRDPRGPPSEGDNSDDDPDDADEVWQNAGKEFSDETAVNKMVRCLKRSVFWHLGEPKVRELVRVLKIQNKKMGDVLFEEGQEITSVILLDRGEVELSVDGAVQSTVVGEKEMEILDCLAYMHHGHKGHEHTHLCTARCTSSAGARVFVMPRDEVTAFAGWASVEKLVQQGSAMSLLSTLRLFKYAWKPQEREMLVECLEHEVRPTGSVIVARGTRGNGLILVQHGKLRLRNSERTRVVSIGKARFDKGAGAPLKDFVMGCREIINDCTYDHTVDVMSSGVLVWRLPEDVCRDKLPKGHGLRRLTEIAVYRDTLPQSVIFSKLKVSDPRMRELVEESPLRVHWEMQDIVEAGDPANSAFVLLEGEVAIILKTGVEVKRVQACASSAKIQYFGELAILEQGHSRQATVRVVSESASVMWMNATVISRVFGTVESLLAEQKLDPTAAARLIRERMGVFKVSKPNIDAGIDEAAPLKSSVREMLMQDHEQEQQVLKEPWSRWGQARVQASTEALVEEEKASRRSSKRRKTPQGRGGKRHL